MSQTLSPGDASRTAIRVAGLRAVHRLLDDPIVFDDPIALSILGPETEARLRDDPFKLNDSLSRGLRAAVVVRSRFAEDQLAKATERGVLQYVILGAGLDTFAYRNPFKAKGLRVFEVDRPATQIWKRQLLSNAGIAIPPELSFVGMNFEAAPLGDILQQAGFRMEQPAFFSWLGVTMYLTEAAIFETLKFVTSLPKGSSITFDFRVFSSSPIARAIDEVLAQRAAEVGEPWISAFDPSVLRSRIFEIGFGAAEIYGSDQLNERYLHRRKDGLRTGGQIMFAQV
jgi:methyltransferase (TIGR00027 family)